MTLSEAAKLAREHADVCIDPSCHAVANALEGAIAAERMALDRSLDPEPNFDGIPPWSQVCLEGESKGPLPF